MAWLRIDDTVPEHRKMLEAGPDACWLWLCGIAYAQRQLTDGYIPKSAVPVLGVTPLRRALKLCDVLVAVGLFEAADGGYRIVKTPLARFATTERPKLRGLLDALVEFWGESCVYCGASDVPLEVEHIVPRSRGGADELGNLTLACAPCNQRKSTKTAAEFGHPHIHEQAKGIQ